MRWELVEYTKNSILDKNLKFTARWKRYAKRRFRTKREALKWLREALILDKNLKLEGRIKYTLRGGVKRG